jgi:hypothetical protein
VSRLSLAKHELLQGVVVSTAKANRLLSLVKDETIASANQGQDHHIPAICPQQTGCAQIEQPVADLLVGC